jgi:adenylate cyclase
MPEARFVPIVRKVNAIIVVSLVVGIGAITGYSTWRVSTTIGGSVRESLLKQSDILTASIQNAMLQGEAPVVVSLFDDLRVTNPTYEIALYRSGGKQAFSDNGTIETVNANLTASGSLRRFEERPRDVANAALLADATFRASLDPVPDTKYEERMTAEGQTEFRILRPVLNLPRCSSCHGATHTVRGVLDIRNDISASIRAQRLVPAVSAAFFLVAVVVLAFVLATYLRVTVIRPVKLIGEVCTAVTAGSFERRVEVRSRDEIGVLGSTVNSMVQGLHERYELSKFVSASTLASLGDRRVARKVELALLFSDVRGFTSYSERTDPTRVVECLNSLLTIQTEIIHRDHGDVDKYVGDEIVAIFGGERAVQDACVAAAEIQKNLRSHVQRHDGLRVGIGIDAGVVILGMIGSAKRADYTVIGDHVNTAARLCQVAGAGQVLLSGAAYQRVREVARADGPRGMALKGKAEPVVTYILRSIRRRSP